ncbi:MAG: S41 family peptidase, partial [Bacteroidota bacterium]
GFTEEEVSVWIYDWMNTVYLWNDQIPQNLNPANEPNPVSFFYSLIYEEEDIWSYITDDFESFKSELAGTPVSMGYSAAFGRYSNTNGVFIIVEYVIPNTPASEAGLERGDIIVSINNTELDTANYRTLYSQESYTAGLAEYDGNDITSTGETVNLTAEVITSSPVIHQEIINYQEEKIGYLVYVDFLSGSNDRFVSQLDEAFSAFADSAIDELIIDLRYNPGGEVSMASHLASMIAPASAVNSSNVLVSYIYNDFLNELFLSEGGENSEDLNLFFTNPPVNLDMNKVYFMTTSGTASASELVITGLDPYMEVTTVGETTFGKYTGAWVLPDSEEPPRHNYAIVPIVLKYANSLGITEFVNGLDPDHPIKDQLLGAEPFGSLSDPVLAKTLEVITGVNPSPISKKSFERPDYEMIPDRKKIFQKSIQVRRESMDHIIQKK